MLLLLACVSSASLDASDGRDTSDTLDTAAPSDSASEEPCPSGMVQVLDFCIDAFEATVEGDLGYADQRAEWPATSTAASADPVEGAVPTVELSWYQARGACLNAGKHLCTVEEWQSACGAAVFPWGDAPAPEEVCAIPAADGSTAWEGLQPAGSLPECRTPGGVFDQVGNAWEWADPGTFEDDGEPITAKLGGAWYAGQGSAPCDAAPMQDHAPWFQGTIAARCCSAARR